MTEPKSTFSIRVGTTEAKCPIGEKVGSRNLAEGKIPVLSCEGACIRGEIARLAVNLVAKETPCARGCHGELLTVPDSAMARWIREADEVVLNDGCFLRCHGRILENIIGKGRLIQFDALSFYRKYTDIFDIDGVPEAEWKAVARDVADRVLALLKERKGTLKSDSSCEDSSTDECRGGHEQA